MVRPTTPRSRPRRTTSTSGSSGTVEVAPGGFGGLLLGFLLAAAGPLAVHLALDDSGGRERLLVGRAPLPAEVLRYAETPRRGQLLQAGLPVERGTLCGRCEHQRVEQPTDHGGRGLEPAVEVDRADQRLHRVGQDRRLVAAPGDLLAPAQAQPLAELHGPRDAGQGARVDDAGAQLRELTLRQVGVGAVER